MLRWVLAVLLLTLSSLWAATAAAQATATLVADRVFVAADGRLVAEGNVEAHYDGTRLSAARITYDAATDSLVIEGPIFIVGAGGEILTADRAELDPRLENGLLRGARLVLDRQLQLAANRIDRVDGTLSGLSRVAATSCAVCDGRPPLWEIRAERVVHDAAERQLHFDNAVLRIRGVPVFWLPHMRLPDPTLTRATGLLVPGLRTTDQLGLGLRLPLFIRLGDSRDLTLTPYLSSRTTTLEARYRQAFLRGEIAIETAVSRDDIRPGDWRGLIGVQGRFDLGRGVDLQFDAMTVSDPAYLLDYGLSDRDRIESGVILTRVRPHDLIVAELTGWQSLREGESFDSLPPLLAAFGWERRFAAGPGTLTLAAAAEAFVRPADTPGAAARDVARAGLDAVWRADTVLGPGLLAEGRLALALDAWAVADDPAFADPAWRAVPAIQGTLRWPLVRRAGTGAVQVIEPALALSWATVLGESGPNEASLLAEFDAGNLLTLSRPVGRDVHEAGAVLAAGLTWTRIGPMGDSLSLTFGRVLRDSPQDGFSPTSGLDGRSSAWLVSGSLALSHELFVQARTLLDDDLGAGRTEARLHWTTDRFDMAAEYVWLPADAIEGRNRDVSEWTLSAGWDISETWSIRAGGRYDIVNNSPARADLGLSWANECVTVDLSLARRYTETDTAEPATDLGLSVTLNGFSAGRSATPVAACRN